MWIKRRFLITLLLLSGTAIAQRDFRPQPSIDVLDYNITLRLTDNDDTIQATNEVKIAFNGDTPDFYLNLAGKDSTGKGMEVLEVIEISHGDYMLIDFRHVDDYLVIYPMVGFENTVVTYAITYKGVPKDGLVFGQNKYGNRTVFGDNWPNRAHHWFPCIDHPSEKASVSYTVEAPSHYQCVANGALTMKTAINDSTTITKYTTSIPLPTKVMVIGVAELVHQSLKDPSGLDHQTWVYPEDKKAGFKDMSVAVDPLNFFIKNIGAYPYEKLYNVQSTTRYGGMENAGCIFYDENAVTGNEKMENLIAHEIAHQWFGNSASETDWQHLWLSEGFATYFTNLYLEDKYGRERMNEQLIKDRERVIRFSKNFSTPTIDTLSTDLLYLLNPNSYQKGSWFLHMLRNHIGDEAFWAGIRNYYDAYKFSNARTSDFRAIMEAVHGASLKRFFDQWLRQAGHPVLSAYSDSNEERSWIVIEQKQTEKFSFPLEIKLHYTNGKSEVKTIEFTNETKLMEIDGKHTISAFEIDPNVKLLFEFAKIERHSNRN